MKSTAKEIITEERVIYPCLMKSMDQGTILIVSGSRYDKGSSQLLLEGTVVNSGNGPHKIGYHSNKWAGLCFEPFHGEVTLTDK